MQFIQRVRWPLSTRAARLRRVRGAVRRLMGHVGLQGQCDCVLTHDADGREGVLVYIETPQCVPSAERPRLQAYFQRKLLGLVGERGAGAPGALRLHIVDGSDRAGAQLAPVGHVSSRQVAAMLRQANPASVAPARNADRVSQLREHLSARRRQRIDSDFSPLQGLALTDLSPLGEA